MYVNKFSIGPKDATKEDVAGCSFAQFVPVDDVGCFRGSNDFAKFVVVFYGETFSRDSHRIKNECDVSRLYSSKCVCHGFLRGW